jgi:Domain of unknown function (DUF4262)
MPREECQCRLCTGDLDQIGPGSLTALEHVPKYGWSVIGVPATDEDIPGWAYTIGLWHTLRSPEVVVFGLPVTLGHRCLNALGESVRVGPALEADQRRDDVLEDYPVLIRPVHPSWYRSFLGQALDFYQQPPLPFMQLVLPDEERRFPGEEGFDPSGCVSQPRAWLPREDHPVDIWRDLDCLDPWPFPGLSAYTLVVTTERLMRGDRVIRQVAHDEEGHWTFLDGDPYTEDDLVAECLHHLVADHRETMESVAALPAGYEAWSDDGITWKSEPLIRGDHGHRDL